MTMQGLKRRISREQGFSLAEMMVTVALLGVVIAVTWNAYNAMFVVQQVALKQSIVSQELGFPLSHLRELLMQETQIEAVDGNDVTFLTDRNADQVRERHYVTVSGSTLHLTTWTIDQSGVETTKTFDADLSVMNANVAQGEPLIVYYDTDGDEITDDEAVPSDARSAYITIMIEYEGDLIEDSTVVAFRNTRG
jgi:prepilin-type N-terminal cleavage/methylation domain-containing protein